MRYLVKCKLYRALYYIRKYYLLGSPTGILMDKHNFECQTQKKDTLVYFMILQIMKYDPLAIF